MPMENSFLFGKNTCTVTRYSWVEEVRLLSKKEIITLTV